MVKGRKAKNAISPSAEALGKALRQVCGYAERELHMKKIRLLREVLTRKVLEGMMDWLIEDHKNKSSGIKSTFGFIHALLTQHSQYKKGDHSWLRDRMARLPREPRCELDDRLNTRSISHTQLEVVPGRIRAEIASSRDPMQIAWLQHDLLFFTWTLYHPWRNRNLRECCLQANLIYEDLPLQLEHELGSELPRWVARRLKEFRASQESRANPSSPSFLQFMFREWENKGKRLVRNLVARELHRLYWDYRSEYRPRLLEDLAHPGKLLADPGTLFFSRRRKSMTQTELTELYAGLTKRHIGRRGTPHRNRDSYAAHVLETGGSIVAVQQALWHKKLETTVRYCRLFNASHGAVALSRHFAKVFGNKSKKTASSESNNPHQELQAFDMVARKKVPVSRNGKPQSSETLDLLLTRIRQQLSHDPHSTNERVKSQMSNLRTTASHLAQYLKKKLDKVEIGEIVDIDDAYSKYLAKRLLKKSTINGNRSRLHLLLRYARQLGVAPQLFTLENEWEPVRLALKGSPAGQAIVKDALKRKIHVAEYCDEDLERWGKNARAHMYARQAKSRFRLILRRSGLDKQFPFLNVQLRNKPSTRLRLKAMGPRLRREIQAILKWMRADAKRGVIRMNKETESCVVASIEDFCGFGIRTRKGKIRKSRPPARLASLFNWKYVSKYVKSLHEETDCLKLSITNRIAPLERILRFHPTFSKLNKYIFQKALALIGKDEESGLILRREKREIHQSALLKIVLDLDQQREKSRNLSRKDRAWLCHDELLMLFFACFPWFARCLSTCRFKGSTPNVFKGRIPRDGPPFGLTARARALFDLNPKARFWQFSFKAKETRYGYPARGLMPDFIVPLLERRARYQRVLTESTGVITLFVNRAGRPLKSHGLTRWLLNITSRRRYRPVTPVACRRIFAYYWLAEYPDDYERLAAILWMKISSVVARYPPTSKSAQLAKQSFFASKAYQTSRGRA